MLFTVVNELHDWNMLDKLVIPTKYNVSVTLDKTRLEQKANWLPPFDIIKGPHCKTFISFCRLDGFKRKLNWLIVPVIVIV